MYISEPYNNIQHKKKLRQFMETREILEQQSKSTNVREKKFHVGSRMWPKNTNGFIKGHLHVNFTLIINYVE